MPSISMSAIHIISFFHGSAFFSSIRFAKIRFGSSKGSISGLLCFGFFCMELRWVPLAHIFVCVSYLAFFNYFKFCLSIFCYWNWIFLITKINFLSSWFRFNWLNTWVCWVSFWIICLLLCVFAIIFCIRATIN